MSTTPPTTTTGVSLGCNPMDMGLAGINPTDGAAETAGMTSGTTLGATAEEPTGTIHGAGTVLGATADITMVTVVTVEVGIGKMIIYTNKRVFYYPIIIYEYTSR